MDRVLHYLIQGFIVVLILYMIARSYIAPPACIMLPSGVCQPTSSKS